MKNYQINLKKELNSIYPTLEHLQGVNPNGEHISFTNHYMMKDEKPFLVFVVSFTIVDMIFINGKMK